MTYYTFKLIFRSWRHNKLFFAISVLSMAIGLACTNMLLAFVIFESNIESTNPEKKNILYMSQPYPMETTKMVSYVAGSIPQMIKDRYPEIKDYARFSNLNVDHYSIGKGRLSGITFLSTDPSFPDFFPYQSIHGELSHAFASPNKVALSERFAKQLFGDAYPVGQIIRVAFESDTFSNSSSDPEETDYEIVAVVKDKPQAFITFDMLTVNSASFSGGVALLLTNGKLDADRFGERLKADGIPTLMGDVGEYTFSTLQDSYFNDYSNESIPYIKRQQRVLLHTGWLAAILVLIIAGINYVNLSYSRLLEQTKRIKIQQLTGASPWQIGLQLFFDTFLTILIAFLMSILIVHDLTPVFNSVVSGRLSTGFFLSAQVLPVLLFLLLLLSVSASVFMSRMVVNKPIQVVQQREKQRSIRILSITQFAISFALLIAALTVNRQLSLIKQGGQNYKGVIEIGSYDSNPEHIRLFCEKAEQMPEIENYTTANTSVLFSSIRQLIIKQDDGEEYFASILEHKVNPNFMKTLSLDLLLGLPPEEACRLYASPVYVNEEFLHALIPEKENPVGKPLATFDKDFRERTVTEGDIRENKAIIAGVVSNLFTNSFEERIKPQVFLLEEGANRFVLIRLEKLNQETIKTLEGIWKEVDPTGDFACTDVFQQYMERNRKVARFANLLMMYSVISLFLTAFGLFGIAYYATTQRVKEIGVRRVNGATRLQILLLLNRRFVYWICLAFLIASPPAWLLLQKWLQHFVYRAAITPDIFFIAAVLILGVTLLAVSLHSYRAATRNPVESIKSE